jgi:hypothetical protein
MLGERALGQSASICNSRSVSRPRASPLASLDVVSPSAPTWLTDDSERPLPNFREDEGVFWHPQTIARR